jgi:hypothetical protein
MSREATYRDKAIEVYDRKGAGIDVDDEAEVEFFPDGAWVQAWVFVSKAEVGER